MLSSMSDKALIYEIKGGNLQALDVLACRYGVKLLSVAPVLSAIAKMQIPSISAVKRVLYCNARPS